jgi:hypothetical protein
VQDADNDSSGKPHTVWQRIKRFFGGDKLDRERLKRYGLGAVCSYGFVSNVTYGADNANHCRLGTCVTVLPGHLCCISHHMLLVNRAGGGMAVAWIYFVKQRGLSPLMPGQWKAFLAYYAGEN